MITNRRIIHAEGVINKQATDSSLEKINDAVLEGVDLRPDLRLRRPRGADGVGGRDQRLDKLRDAKEFKKAMLEAKHELELELGRPTMPPMRTTDWRRSRRRPRRSSRPRPRAGVGRRMAAAPAAAAPAAAPAAVAATPAATPAAEVPPAAPRRPRPRRRGGGRCPHGPVNSPDDIADVARAARRTCATRASSRPRSTRPSGRSSRPALNGHAGTIRGTLMPVTEPA